MSDTSRDSAFNTGTEEGIATAFGMWIFLASEAMMFTGLLLVYAFGRLDHATGFANASGHLDWRLGALNTAILICSSLAIARAEARADRADRRAGALLALTCGLGVLFLGIKGYEWTMELREGLAPFAGLAFAYDGPDAEGAAFFFRCYFILTGLHAAHMLGGLACIGWLLATWRNRRCRADFHAVRDLALYWHFVDIVWIFLYPLLYLIAPA